MAASALTIARSALAAEPSARELFDAGIAAMKRGDFEKACPRFAQAEELDPHVGYAASLARCEARTGKLLAARRHWLEALELARAHNDERRAEVERGLSEAERALPKLVIRAPNAPNDLRVWRDGEELAEFGAVAQVDSGVHVIEAEAPGYARARVTIETAADGATSVVVVPPLEARPEARPAPIPVSTTPPRAPPRTQRVIAGGVAIGGAIALGAAGYFASQAGGKNSASRDHCVGNVCDEDGKALRDDALANANRATALSIGGAIAVVTGAVLWLSAPKYASVSPRAVLGEGGVVGTW